MSENIFADEWRDCLRAHYMHVVRNNDHVTEPTLRVVMHDAGFSESELAELRVRATMHVDDVGADFVPDLDVLNPAAPSEPAPAGEPAGEAFYSIATPVETDYPLPDEVIDDALLTDELPPAGEALTDETLTGEAPALEAPDEPSPDPDAPQQLRLF